MAKFIGRRTNLGIAKEASRGAGATPTYWEPRTTLSFNDRTNKVNSGEAYGHIDDSTDSFVTQLFGDGNVEGEVHDNSFGLLLYSMLGSVSSALTDVTAYTHTFTEANSNQHQSLCFVMDTPQNDDAMFRLVMLNSLTLNIANDGITTYSASFMSKPSVDSTETASYTLSHRFIGKHLTVKLADAVGSLTAASGIPLKSLNITFNKNTVADYNIGTVEPTEIHNQQFSVEGSFTLNYEDNTYRDYMTAETYKAMRIQAVNTDVTLTGSSSNPTFTIDLSRCSFNSWDADNSLDAISQQTISFKGHKDVENSLNIVNQATLINLVTSY